MGNKMAIVMVACLLLMASCQKWGKGIKHIKSSYVGLHRTVTVYDCQGKPIRQWTGKFMVETTNGTISFIGEDGKERKATGTVIVEEQ